jgi:hypothetical protein
MPQSSLGCEKGVNYALRCKRVKAEYCLKNVVFSMIVTIVDTDVSRFSMTVDFVFGSWLAIVVAQLLKVDP